MIMSRIKRTFKLQDHHEMMQFLKKLYGTGSADDKENNTFGDAGAEGHSPVAEHASYSKKVLLQDEQ